MKSIHFIAALAWLMIGGLALADVISGAIAITGPVAPTDTTDTYPTHFSKYGKGGLHSVYDATERDAIPAARREAGMLVVVTSTRKTYQLGANLTTWTEVRPNVVVDTFSELASIPTSSLPENAIVRSSGFYQAGDGGGADYVFRSNSTSTNLPNTQVAGGALHLAFWRGELEVFGAKAAFLTNAADVASLVGVDSSGPIQAAVDYAASLGGGTLRPLPGTYWLSKSIQWKPKVSLVGSLPAGYLSSRSTSLGRTSRLMGQTYWEGYNASGKGFPIIVCDGSVNYTNEFYFSFGNKFGETIYYRSGANSFEKMVFSCYQWGTGGTNKYPVSGIVIDQVEGVAIQNCAFHDIAGFGIWAQGALGMRLKGSMFRNCLIASHFVTSTSDCSMTGNTFGGDPVWLYSANTHVFGNNEVWNPRHSLLNASGATTNVTEYGVTRPYLIERTHYSDSSTDEIVQKDGSQWGTDVGSMVFFTGTGIPSPFVAGQPYFVVNNPSNYAKIKLAATPKNAIEGTVIDVTSSVTNTTWTLTGFSDAFTAYDCEEIFFQNNRLDQTWKTGVRFFNSFRSQISDNQIWEIGLNMGPLRYNRVEFGERRFTGVWLDGCGDMTVTGNTLQGGFRFGVTANALLGRYDGVYLTNCINVGIGGNSFSELANGIYSDLGCSNVRDLGNSYSPTVSLHANAANTNGLNSVKWPGIYLARSNVVWSQSMPAAMTNLTDFTLTFGLPWGIQQAVGNDWYDPIGIIGPSTNFTSGSLTPERSLGLSGYTFNGVTGETNTVVFVNFAGPAGSYLRGSQTVAEHRLRNMPLELVLVRTGASWKLYANSFELPLTMNVTGGSAPAADAAIHAKHLLLGPWTTSIHRHGWITEAILQNKGFTPNEIRDGRHRIAGTNLVFHWDFKGDTGSTVVDKSGNGVHGTVVSLDGTTLHSFGPTQP